MKLSRKTDLSVIVLNYNTADFLSRCLTAVREAIVKTPEYKIEVIVVDNGSSDGSVKTVQRRFGWVKLIVSQRNLGYAAGNNLGVSKANGRYLLFLNSDTEVKQTAFAKSLGFMEAHPRAGALSAKTLLADGQFDPDCHRGFPTPWASITYFIGLEKLFPQSKFFGQYHQIYFDLEKNHQIDAGAGAFMLVRRAVIDQVGSWDEAYFFYGEDLDFFYRIKKAGWEVWYLAQPLVTHFKGVSSGLRKESKRLTKVDRATRLKVAKASINAMEIFYRKFYQGQYPKIVTELVLIGIRVKGWGRLLKQNLKK